GLRAVRAAHEARDALRGHGLEPRIGVGTGEALVGGPIAGTPVSTARALEQAAQPGEILLSPRTLQLLAGAVSTEPARRGTAIRRRAFAEGAPAIERRLDAPLVDRTDGLAALQAAFAQAGAGKARLVTVLGEAGIGKTRLAIELYEKVR